MVSVFVIAVVVLVVALSVSGPESSSSPVTDWESEFLRGPSAEQARANIEHFSAKEHVAATEQNNQYAQDIRDIFLDLNLNASLIEYGSFFINSFLTFLTLLHVSRTSTAPRWIR